jgi:hypothetical protein
MTMTDLVARLRDYAVTGNRPSLWPHAMCEAADEIERLRGIAVSMATDIAERDQEIERLRLVHEDYVIHANANIFAFYREIEQLRAALETCRQIAKDREKNAFTQRPRGDDHETA